MRRIWIILVLALILTGCKTSFDIKPDTIVDIPLHPTEEATERETEEDMAPEETQTQPVTEPPTETATKPAANSGDSGGKKPSESKPPATQPPTDPPTDPPTEPPTQPVAYDPSGYAPGSLDRSVAEAVNGRRQEAGLEPLSLDTRLCAIASVRAREACVLWSHSRPDGSAGISVLGEYGYGYTRAGENLYLGVGSPVSVVDQWMGSGSNQENILMEEAVAIGVGSFTAPDGLVYVAALIVG